MVMKNALKKNVKNSWMDLPKQIMMQIAIVMEKLLMIYMYYFILI